jgi:phospholysine phosphohistidine inorganic pyrophosphate phosphatase
MVTDREIAVRDPTVVGMRCLLIDLDGVLYEGDRCVAGAIDVLAWLDDQAIPRLFLTNTTSLPRAAVVEKLGHMGVSVVEDDILTPPVVAARWLRNNASGPVALFVPPATASEFSGIDLAKPGSSEPAGAVVIGDYGDRWSFAELNRAFRLLMMEPRPIMLALGMTRYWRAPDGLRLDTAPFVMALCHAAAVEPIVLGKPAAPFFEAALSQLRATPDQALMIGDDIRTDIDAAQALGIRGILVKTGKFLPSDLDLKIFPYAILESIVGLPDWWQKETARAGEG